MTTVLFVMAGHKKALCGNTKGEVTMTQRTAMNYDNTSRGATKGLTYNNEARGQAWKESS